LEQHGKSLFSTLSSYNFKVQRYFRQTDIFPTAKEKNLFLKDIGELET
jgi:hypothetical protein